MRTEKAQTLTKRLKPLLSGAVSMDQLDDHTRQSLDIYVHFKCSALIELPPEQIKAEIERMPESVRDLVRYKARRLYEKRFLPIPRPSR